MCSLYETWKTNETREVMNLKENQRDMEWAEIEGEITISNIN